VVGGWGESSSWGLPASPFLFFIHLSISVSGLASVTLFCLSHSLAVSRCVCVLSHCVFSVALLLCVC
jgi:hypothetical protein